MRTARRCLLLAGLCCGIGVVQAQQIDLGNSLPGQSAGHRQHVELQTGTATVKAGAPDWIELRFEVDPGLHINSHTPHDELLVPTTFEVSGSDRLKVVGSEYPAGVPLRLDVGAGEVLSTYQGQFAVRLHVLVPAKGEIDLAGTLHYQACDARSCFPPKNLPVHVTVTAH